MTSPKNIVIAGGGTGGHIYPGIAIARALLKKDPTIKIHFVGTAAGLESKIVPREGFELHLIESGKLNMRGSIFVKLKTLFKMPYGLVQSLRLLWSLKPIYVIGVGGYASGPFVLAASLIGFPSAIWEPNAMPGLANRMLSRFVDKCFIVFKEARVHLKNKNIRQTGMPVREEITNAMIQPRSDEKFHLLSFGGSQGARAINNVLSDALLEDAWTEGLSVVHQTGSLDYKRISEKYRGAACEVTAFEFIFEMPKYYSWADIIVSRGGASTIAEAAAFGIIPIIIPLPAADDHQKKNAESLVEKNAGRMILQKELTPERLIQEIQSLRNDKALRAEMVQNIKSFYIPAAAESIANEILEGAS